jgi:hypothetical protein
METTLISDTTTPATDAVVERLWQALLADEPGDRARGLTVQDVLMASASVLGRLACQVIVEAGRDGGTMEFLGGTTHGHEVRVVVVVQPPAGGGHA